MQSTQEKAKTTSQELFERSKKVTTGGVHSPVHTFSAVGGSPFVTQRGYGAYLSSVEGKEVVDFIGGWGPHIHGQDNAVIKDAIKRTLDEGTTYGTLNPHAVELSEKIVSLIPSVEKIRMTNSGTEATMSAIRLARGFTGRDKIIKFEGCYHGHADYLLVKAGSGGLTHGNPDSAGVPAAFAQETIVLPYNDSASLEKAFAEYSDELAAVIIEPYPGNCGFLKPSKGYLQKLRELCTKNKTVLIFDEVMTGFRIGLHCVQGEEGITPDLSAFGKIIGGGLPVGAFGGKSEIMDRLSPLGPVYQGGTFCGNPLSMAAGLASIQLLEQTMPYALHDQMSKRIKQTLMDAAEKKGIALQVNQSYSMWSFFFNENPVDSFDKVMASDREPFKKVFLYALDKGVLLPPSPFETCFIGTAHQGEPLDKALEVLSAAIESL